MKGGGWVSTLEDITRWRELQEQDCVHGASRCVDRSAESRPFSGAACRRELARTSRNGEIAVHCIDLDNFKDINDALGPPSVMNF